MEIRQPYSKVLLCRGAGTVIGSCLLAFVFAGSVAPLVSGGSDYIAGPPPTVYEDPMMSPQTMDYDRQNKTFLAHPGWIRDKLIHYYKFRMYTPMTYPERVSSNGPPDIPIGAMYLLTTGGFSGIVAGQKPILQWHTQDGESYSDFVEVMWATVSPAYAANTYRSYGDLVENGTVFSPSAIFANVPVVPTGSRLQDPSGSGFAPIAPLMAWHRGVEVQTFVFETTDQAFADHFNPVTRSGGAGQHGSGFEITVSPFVSGGTVSFIPIWHLNQYWAGVQPGVNSGGPWSGGQRNIIDRDRGAAGYSPLWQVLWVSQVPFDYAADQASSAQQLVEANGFHVLATPMYVNCPNVGPVGGSSLNPRKASSFGRSQVDPGEVVRVAGALVMEAGVPLDAYVGDTKVASATTAMMGGYEFLLPTGAWPDGQVTITVRDAAGTVLQTTTLTKTGGIAAAVGNPAFAIGVAIVLAVVTALLVFRWRKRTATRREGNPPPGDLRPRP